MPPMGGDVEPRGRIGTQIAGKWTIDERIGSGGMATVYAATHRNGMRAALKMLHAPLSRDASTRARFLREGYVANSVGHDGVVAVLDDGVTEDGSAFLVLELLEGQTLDELRHHRGGQVPVDEALDIGRQTLEALAAAHEKGIVHRDVKPENVFITNDGVVKILDFGLAHMKDAQGEATKTGVTIGTPEFMPPEQAQGRRDKVDPRSDVWMVGATLFTIITGAFVHDDAQTIHEALIASATRRPRPVSELAPHLPPAVAQVIDRALELEMSDRWESAAHMRSALLAAQTASHSGKYDSETALAMSISRGSPSANTRQPETGDEWRRNRPLGNDDTMQDSEPVDVHAEEVDLEPTHVALNSRPAEPRPMRTDRMQGRPRAEFRGPMPTPSEEHQTFAAPPRSMPPPSIPAPPSHNSMPPSIRPPPSLRPIADGSEPMPIASIDHFRGSLPPQSLPSPQPPPKGQSSKETIALVALALFFLCAAMGAYMMRRRPQ